MHLALNYSPAAAKLVQSGQIKIDFFKTPNCEWVVKEASILKPVAVHFNLEAGNDNLGEVDWENVQKLSQATGTPYVNLHLDARQSYYPELSVDTVNDADVEKVRRTIVSDVLGVVKRFGPERVIIENSPYQGIEGNTLSLCVQPELIARVVRETGCGLLLDISHAIITARFIGMDPGEYISSLPGQAVKELHFAGIHRNQITDQWIDHLSIQAEDWYWLDYVLNRIQAGKLNSPWLLVFEYGGVGELFEWRSNPEVIAAQVPELNKHLSLMNN